jgi:hypothetical protein
MYAAPIAIFMGAGVAESISSSWKLFAARKEPAVAKTVAIAKLTARIPIHRFRPMFMDLPFTTPFTLRIRGGA